MNIIRQRYRSVIAKLLLLVLMTIALVPAVPFVPGAENGKAYAAELYNSLATQAVINNYAEYKGDIGLSSPSMMDPFDVYVLKQANVAVDTWSYGENNIKQSILELITTTKTLEEDGDPSNNINAKHVAYQYLAAGTLEENGLAEDLLNILIARHTSNGNGTFYNGDWNQWTNLPVFDGLSRAGVMARLGEDGRKESIDYILSLQENDGSFSDYMSTAQAVRALHCLKASTPEYNGPEIETAVNSALTWMQGKLQEDGSLVDSPWSEVVTDTAEAIITLQHLGQEPNSWKHPSTNKSPVDYMRDNAKNPDNSFGSGNVGATTWGLDAYIHLGAVIPGDAGISMSITPDSGEIAVGEKLVFTATALLASGETADVTSSTHWTVNDGDIAIIEMSEGQAVVERTGEGDLEVVAQYQLLDKTVIVSTSILPGQAMVTVRIEGPDYTILPDTVIPVPSGSSYTEVLLEGQAANGYTVEESGGFVTTINGLGAPEFYWMTTPYQGEGYDDGDTFVLSGNGSTALGEISLPNSHTATVGIPFTIRVTTSEGQPVEGATVIYYTSENRATPLVAAGTTNADGQLTFSIAQAGTYYLAADKANTAHWPDPDNGLVRTGARSMTITAGGGGSTPQPTGTTVNVTVRGRDGEYLFGPTNVTLTGSDQHGITALGALHKTGLSYSYDTVEYIRTIAGQAPQGLNGWMYKVNNTVPTYPAVNYNLDSRDTVLWFYSTSSDNIVNVVGGGTPAPVNQDLLKTGDEIVTEKLDKGEQVKINLESREEETVSFGLQTIQRLRENNSNLIIESQGIELVFPPNSLITDPLTQVLEDSNISIQLGARIVTGVEKRDILKKAPLGETTGLFDIGGVLVDLTAEITKSCSEGSVTVEKIDSFPEPVQVVLDATALNLREEDDLKLTAVRYSKDAEGNTILTRLGGTYDSKEKTFTFYTDRFSFYGILKAKQLTTISLEINGLTFTINGETGWLDVPPMIINNRTMVPIRMVAETLGAQVDWINQTQTVIIQSGSQKLQFTVGEILAGVDEPARIVNGRTVVPLRYAAENLDASILWFPTTKTIEIVK